MLKRIRLFVTDSPFTRLHRVRDEVLHAERLPKVIASTLWTGSLRPLVDTVIETLGQLSNGLTSGNVLHAEQLAGVIDLGRTWTGSLLSEIRSAVANSSSGPTIDVGETLTEAERLDKLLRSAAPTSGAIADGLARLRAAAGRVGTRTGDAAGITLAKQLVAVTSASIKYMEHLNDQAREFHARHSAPSKPGRPIGDSGLTTALRDGLYAVNHARSQREQLERSNELARELARAGYWAGARA